MISLTLILIFGKITMFVNYPLNIFGIIINKHFSDSLILLNLACVIPLTYLFVCSLSGLFHIKLSGVFSMHRNQNSDTNSLLFLASFMCRIGFPLCLNFIQILKLNTDTVLGELLGIIDLVPVFGKSFTIFYPMILILLCLFNLFDLYGKLLNIFGISSFDTNNKYATDKIEEGSELLNRIRFNFETGNSITHNIDKNGYKLITKDSDTYNNDVDLKGMIQIRNNSR